jgi:hypothetical protein
MPTVSKLASYHTAITTGYTNPSNAYADDGVYATATPGKNTEVSAYFGFAAFSTSDIPDGAVINSVTLEAEWKVSTTTSIATQYWQLYKTTTGLGSEQSNTAEPTTDTKSTHQVTTGVTLSDLRSADTIRGRLRSAQGNSSTAVTFSVDYAKLTVDFTVKLVADPGSFSLSGIAANTLAARKLTGDPGGLTLTGNAAGLAKGYRLTAGAGAYALAGPDVTLTYTPGSAELLRVSWARLDVPWVQATKVLYANAAAFSLAGQSAGLLAGYRLTASPASYGLAGNAAELTYTPQQTERLRVSWVRLDAPWTGTITRTLTAEVGSFVLTGNAATLTAPRRLTAEAGAFVLTGQAAGLSKTGAFSLDAGAGSFSLAGQAANLLAQYRLTGNVAAYTLSGQAANLRRGLRLAAGTGAFTLTGWSAGLSKTGSYALAANTGAFTLTGRDATLTAVRHYRLTAERGTFTLTGQATGLSRGRTLVAERGAFSLAGTATGLRVTRLLTGGAGAFVLTGLAVNLYRLEANIYVPEDHLLAIGYADRTLLIAAADRTLTVEPTDADLAVLAAEALTVGAADRTLYPKPNG